MNRVWPFGTVSVTSIDMARRRLGVALLVPPPQSSEIDGLRRACGDAMLGRVAPHLTLVPPVNVSAEALPAALAVLRSAAAALADPITLSLGPPATFEPVSPTLYLAVTDPGGRTGELDRLHALRGCVFAGPFERSLTHPFVPHVTLVDQTSADRLAVAVPALRSYRIRATFTSVHVLEEHRDPDGVRRWRPLADAVLEPVAVVGRGGLAVELTTSTILGPEEAELWKHDGAVGSSPAGASPPAGADRVIMTARREGQVVGLAAATVAVDPAGSRVAEVASIVVDAAHRRQGVGRALVDALGHRLSMRGVRRAGASVGSEPGSALLVSRGWQPTGPGTFRRTWD